MAEFGEPLSVPLSEITEGVGSNLPPSVVGIAGRAYLMDTNSGEYRREGVNVLQQRNTTSNRDLLLLPQDVWRQMYESWHQGAGQSSLDRDDALPFRYKDSFGVDPWTKYRLSLLNETRRLAGGASWQTNPGFLAVHNGNLCVIHGTDVKWYTPDGVESASYTIGEIAEDFTYDGEFIYILGVGGSLLRTDGTAAPAAVTITWPTATPPDKLPAMADATFVAYVKDYLLVGIGHVLWNITDPAKPVKVYTSPVVGFTWKGAVAGAAAIYLIGGAGDKHEVHRVSVSQDGTKLDPAAVAATLPDGEIGISIGSYLGFVFIGTGSGVRMATPNGGAGDLVLGAIIPTSAPVWCFEGQDRFVWYGNSEMSAKFGLNQEKFPVGLIPGLGRMDLTTFTVTEGTPAYANDIYAQGVTRSGVVRSVATWHGKRVFTVTGSGVYVETDNLVEKGWVAHGDVSFGVEDLKTALYAQFKWRPLEGGSVGMFASYDSDRYTLLAEKDTPQSIRSGNVTMDGQQFSRVGIGLVLRRDLVDYKVGPTFTRWEFRAVPVKGVASRWYLPILNHSTIELNGVTEHRDVREELVRLMKVVEGGGLVALQEGGIMYQVTPKDFQWKPQSLSPTGHAWQGVYLLVVEEIR